MSIRDQAEERRTFNRFSRTNKPIAATAEEDGIAGEVAVSHLFGLEGYTPPVRKRTPGYQFRWQGFAIKILTSRNPMTLLVKEGGVKADIYLLCGIYGESTPENVTIYGWARSVDVLAAPVKVMTRKRGEGPAVQTYEIPSHAIPRADLRKMPELAQILGIPLERLSHRFRYPDLYTDGGAIKHDDVDGGNSAKMNTLF